MTRRPPCSDDPSNAVELTPNTRWPPSSWAADVRSSSGYTGHGVDGAC